MAKIKNNVFLISKTKQITEETPLIIHETTSEGQKTRKINEIKDLKLKKGEYYLEHAKFLSGKRVKKLIVENDLKYLVKVEQKTNALYLGIIYFIFALINIPNGGYYLIFTALFILGGIYSIFVERKTTTIKIRKIRGDK